MTSEPRTGELLPEHLVAPAEPERRGGLMAKQRGRGFATIEYPTGMNQNGDPSQAWIKLKPDGRVDVFSGTVDIGQGSKTVHTPDRRRRARRPLRLGDDGQHEHRLVGGLHRHVRLARHVHRRQRRAPRGRAGARADPRHRLEGARDRPGRPRDRGRRGGRARARRRSGSTSPTSPAPRPTTTAS